ncbi:MAG: CvpA family protein [Alphaproteobacteria bacterium]|nr:CvpA family protein [Alphaproteobacteria bacterium]
MRGQISSPIVADGVSLAILVAISLVIFIPLTNMWASKITGRTMTAIDSSLGFVFGLLRGVVILGMMYLVVLMIWPDEEKMPDALKNAHSRPVLEAIALQVQEMIPDSMKGENIEKLAKQRNIEEAVKEIEESEDMLNDLSVPKPAMPETP